VTVKKSVQTIFFTVFKRERRHNEKTEKLQAGSCRECRTLFVRMVWLWVKQNKMHRDYQEILYLLCRISTSSLGIYPVLMLVMAP
jgi:hypothetical protein